MLKKTNIQIGFRYLIIFYTDRLNYFGNNNHNLLVKLVLHLVY